jgi:hypothetical protein
VPANPLFRLFIALAFLVQALLPTAAFAEVNIRCVGVSHSCTSRVVSLASDFVMSPRMCGMACCHHMWKMACCSQDSHSPSMSVAQPMPCCHLTITLLPSNPVFTLPSAHQHLFFDMLPAALSTRWRVSPQTAFSPLSPFCVFFTLKPVQPAHGLRAPPAV